MSRKILAVPSLAETKPEELRELPSKTERERAWYTDYPVYETNEDIMAAAQKGELKIVNPNKNSSPIGRLRNPELFHHFPPYLLPDSHLALLAIGQLWRTQLQTEGVNLPGATLSVTSLTRSNEVQQDLVRRGKLADRESTHRVGAAFDIDASGYYVHDSERRLAPVVHPERNRAGMRKVADVLKQQVKQEYDPPVANTVYDIRIPAALLTIGEELHDNGFINLVVEFVGQPNQCLHIAPNPNVEW